MLNDRRLQFGPFLDTVFKFEDVKARRINLGNIAVAIQHDAVAVRGHERDGQFRRPRVRNINAGANRTDDTRPRHRNRYRHTRRVRVGNVDAIGTLERQIIETAVAVGIAENDDTFQPRIGRVFKAIVVDVLVDSTAGLIRDAEVPNEVPARRAVAIAIDRIAEGIGQPTRLRGEPIQPAF